MEKLPFLQDQDFQEILNDDLLPSTITDLDWVDHTDAFSNKTTEKAIKTTIIVIKSLLNNAMEAMVEGLKLNHGTVMTRLDSLEERCNALESKVDTAISLLRQGSLQAAKKDETEYANLFSFPIDDNSVLEILQEELSKNANFKNWLVIFLNNNTTIYPPKTNTKKDIDAAADYAVRGMMKQIMTNELAVRYNLRGTNNKRKADENPKLGFAIKCPNIVNTLFDALQAKLVANNRLPTDKVFVENAIAGWLKQAQQRTEPSKMKRRKAAAPVVDYDVEEGDVANSDEENGEVDSDDDQVVEEANHDGETQYVDENDTDEENDASAEDD